jgi:hypothetical protein
MCRFPENSSVNLDKGAAKGAAMISFWSVPRILMRLKTSFTNISRKDRFVVLQLLQSIHISHLKQATHVALETS